MQHGAQMLFQILIKNIKILLVSNLTRGKERENEPGEYIDMGHYERILGDVAISTFLWAQVLLSSRFESRHFGPLRIPHFLVRHKASVTCPICSLKFHCIFLLRRGALAQCH